MAQFKFKRMSGQVDLRRCGGCQIFPAAQFLLDALNGLSQHLCLCERARVVSGRLASPRVSFSTHFAFLSGSNILGSIAGSPQALSQNFQLFIRSLLDSRRSRCIHIFQLSRAKKPCFQLVSVAHGILLIEAERLSHKRLAVSINHLEAAFNALNGPGSGKRLIGQRLQKE
jgi:hypothetical protein